MIAARRSSSNFALDRAIAWSNELRLPLVVLEALRVDYPYASDRLHRFVIDGMADNATAFSGTAAAVLPRTSSPHRARARVYSSGWPNAPPSSSPTTIPASFFRRQSPRQRREVDMRLEAVDGNGLLPLAAMPRAYPAAVHHRRFMQSSPADAPCRHHRQIRAISRRRDQVSASVLCRLTSWRAGRAAAGETRWNGTRAALARLPIDHAVSAVSDARRLRGRARVRSAAFVARRLAKYHDKPQSSGRSRGTSRLSPYLHFGHISAHEVFKAVMRQERWSLAATRREGQRGAGRLVGCRSRGEAFLDQLVVWRELGFNTCGNAAGSTIDRFEGLPGVGAGRRSTAHADRSRVRSLYDRRAFERRETHDAAVERGAAGDACATGGCTTTCGCCGERRSSSGRRRRGRRSTR